MLLAFREYKSFSESIAAQNVDAESGAAIVSTAYALLRATKILHERPDGVDGRRRSNDDDD